MALFRRRERVSPLTGLRMHTRKIKHPGVQEYMRPRRMLPLFEHPDMVEVKRAGPFIFKKPKDEQAAKKLLLNPDTMIVGVDTRYVIDPRQLELVRKEFQRRLRITSPEELERLPNVKISPEELSMIEEMHADILKVRGYSGEIERMMQELVSGLYHSGQAPGFKWVRMGPVRERTVKVPVAGKIPGVNFFATKIANYLSRTPYLGSKHIMRPLTEAEKEKVGSRIQEVGAERGELIAKWERGGIGTDLIRRYREEEQRAMDTQIEKKFKLVK